MHELFETARSESTHSDCSLANNLFLPLSLTFFFRYEETTQSGEFTFGEVNRRWAGMIGVVVVGGGFNEKGWWAGIRVGIW